MFGRPAPVFILLCASLFALAFTFVLTMIALSQPWLGLDLAVTDGAITVMQAQGPAQDIPKGSIITTIKSSAGSLTLEPLDLTTEPDGAMGTYSNWHYFLERQDLLANIIRADSVHISLADNSSYEITPPGKRPFSSLPSSYWVQIIVGLVAWAISVSVFAFRTHETSARYLLLSGAATLTFSPLAGVYSTRELALPATLFQCLNDLNFLGGSLFTASFVALLLHYPKRLGSPRIGIGIVALFLLWFVAQELGLFTSMTFARRFLVVVGFLTTFVLAGTHWWRTRRDPAARAALLWFLMSWLTGTTLFFALILVPQLIGIDTSAMQGYAFLLFLLVYGGLAFGILRYRLFDLGIWWARMMTWLLSLLLLVGLDFAFLSFLHFSSDISLILALVITGLLWLPLRGLIWGRAFQSNSSKREALYLQTVDVALTPPGNDRHARWCNFLRDTFNALEAQTGEPELSQPELRETGLAFAIPGIAGFMPVTLRFAGHGRRLFNPRDISIAEELCQILKHTVEARDAFERGASAERARMARDMHDNIGAQLLSALHNTASDRKDEIIRQSLADLRDLINNPARDQRSLDETLAELRIETAERVDQAGLKFSWEHIRNNNGASISLSSDLVHALRSIIREAVSNTIRHAKAQSMHIKLEIEANILLLSLADNGRGIEDYLTITGNGHANMRTRLEALGGELLLAPASPGLILSVRIPFQ